jgi:hypothetical protein
MCLLLKADFVPISLSLPFLLNMILQEHNQLIPEAQSITPPPLFPGGIPNYGVITVNEI